MTTALLDDFCHRLMEQHVPLKGFKPAALAQEFVDFFGLPTFPGMKEITAQLERAGVETAKCTHLECGLRGVHTGSKKGRYLIEYDAYDPDGSQEHTVLHEFYEITCERVGDLYPKVRKPDGEDLCHEADRFAAATLMQPEVFHPFVERSGLDVVTLQRMYTKRAYSSVALRLVEVMQHQPLLCVMYERREEGEPHLWVPDSLPEMFRTTVVARTRGFKLRTTRRPLSLLRGLLPRRGDPPAPGSIAERVILSGRPFCVDRVSGYDLWHADDLIVAARPVIWNGRVAKVAVIAVPYRDRSVLQPQTCQAAFQHIAEGYQVI